MTVDLEAVRSALRGVIDPELGDDIVDLGMYQRAEADGDGRVTVHVALTTAACPLRHQITGDVEARVGSLPGVTSVVVRTGEMEAEQKRALMARARWKAREGAPEIDLPGRTRVLAVSSGKGGVGKSSVTANLAAGLAHRGYTVGVLDADIGGFSMTRMLGIAERVEAGAGPAGRPRMQPAVKPVGAGELRVLSMGMLSEEDEAVMWRGLMQSRALQHFVEDAAWGDLDYLLVDMPPGTGDIQMALARMLPRAELLVVTTPALAAQKVASRAVDMARRGYLRVAGVIENMSGFTDPSGLHHELFGSGGGARLSAEVGVPLLASIPIQPAVSAGGDTGVPAVLGDGPAAGALRALVDAVERIAPVVEVRDCTAHMLDAVEAALGAAPATA
ncbi:MAG TPA: Mrp/NBP35 family ATP-binding protein [Acidimicrobiales bacterium]|nr:Mrp/NBP35 family ATP-binding protein [Acidimicrobiales bacterium]